MNTANATIGFWFSVIAAVATLLGWLIVAGRKHISTRAIGVALIASALAMLYVSFTQLIPQAFDSNLTLTEFSLWIGIGFGLVVLLRFIGEQFSSLDSLKSSAILVAAAVTAHNLPEGAAAIATTIQNLQAGIATTAAIAIHNIPEGIAIAATAVAAGFSKSRALLFVVVAATAEIMGAGIVLVEVQLLNELLIAKLLTVVAGIMIALSVLELLPHGYAEFKSERD
jgi:zinc transporter, ZIP family